MAARDEAIAAFVERVAAGRTEIGARVALFRAVRDLPYATNGAHDAAGLVEQRRGSCLAKADLLAWGLAQLACETRLVRWLSILPPEPSEVDLLPSRDDIHTAVEARVTRGASWILVDATHDLPLATGGLTVAEWDGVSDTPPAYPPQGPLWRVGQDDRAIAAAWERIDARWREAPAGRTDPYQPAFNAWLDALRANT